MSPSTSSEQHITHLVVHKLVKDQHGPASITLRSGTSPVTASAQRFIDDITQHYADKLGKGYGKFEDDEASFPVVRLIREHVRERSIDFPTLSRQMMEHLRDRIDVEQLASGGYVLMARLRNSLSDHLLIALITEAMGTAITADLEIVDSPHRILPICASLAASICSPGKTVPSATSASSRGAAMWRSTSSCFSVAMMLSSR